MSRYRHSHNYCTKTPRCVRCGNEHLSNDCKQPKTAQPKCANCGEAHTSNYKGCLVYQKLTQAAPNPIKAIDRIREVNRDKTTRIPVSNPSARSYAAAARFSNSAKPAPANASNATKIPRIRDQLSDASAKENGDDYDLSKLFGLMQDISSSHKMMETNLQSIASRMDALESRFSSPSPLARKKRK